MVTFIKLMNNNKNPALKNHFLNHHIALHNPHIPALQQVLQSKTTLHNVKSISLKSNPKKKSKSHKIFSNSNHNNSNNKNP
jgi:hypothetical protein